MVTVSAGPARFPLRVRAGQESDTAAVLALWDTAIAWLVARGQTGQWGAIPASARPQASHMVREWAAGSGLRVAELDRKPVGASVITSTPPEYVPPAGQPETYLLFLVADRTRGGLGIGSALARQAAADARAADSQVLRVDCWADAPDLVAWYERQGFTRSATFTIKDSWRGQLLEMRL
jgi:ribosomal protein S18 acetylase RimI-like enzyme